MGDRSTHRTIGQILASSPDDVDWGLHISGGPADGLSVHADRVLMTASVGKVMLLAAVSHAIDSGGIDPDELLARDPGDQVTDSGLWQHLRAESLAVADAAVLVASVSDNLATNVLLRRIGLAAVQAMSHRLGAPHSVMLDRIRDARTEGDPAGPSQATAGELARVLARLASAGTDSWESRVRDWLSLSTDLSMVAAALCLDPLAHSQYRFVGKTGTDLTVRADTGSLVTSDGTIAYAVIANWSRPSKATADAVVRAMRAIGEVALAGGVRD